MAPTSAATASAPPESWPGAHTTDWPGPVGQRRPATGGSGEEVEVGIGGGLDPSPPRLSVVELQAVLRAARRRAAGDKGTVPQQVSCDQPMPALDAGWTTVSAAHPGAGATTLALAVAEAAAVRDRDTHLIELADPWRSGLVAASDTEFGVDADLLWRTGRRAAVTVHRRAAAVPPAMRWPALPTPGVAGSSASVEVVVDVGTPASANLDPWARSGRWVLVCRASVPGVQAVEAILAQTPAEQPSAIGPVVAVLGPRRWPSSVTAAIGPQLARLRDLDRLVTVSSDPRLAFTGLTSAPLPKLLRLSGIAVLDLLDRPLGDRTRHEEPDTARGAQS